MIRFRDRPIRLQLMLVLLAISVATAVFATAGFIVSELATFPATLRNQLRERARVMAFNSTVALEFDDPETASNVLSTLDTDPSVVAAAIYRTNGAVFARFIRTNEPAGLVLPRPEAPPGDEARDGRIHVFQRILSDSRWIGDVYLQSDQRELRARLRRHLEVSVVVLTIAVLLAAGLAVLFQRALARPILDLAATADAVATGRDYSARAQVDGRDELGLLAGRFNEMLAQIEARNDELRQARDDLEQRVSRRTQELSRANESLIQQITERERARAALNASEALYRSTVDALDAALHVVGPDLTVLLCNARLREWRASLGLPDEKIVGRHVAAAFPFPPITLDKEYAEVLASRRPVTTRETVELAGRLVFTESRKIPIVEGGTVRRIITLIRDVTEQQRIEDQLRQAQKMEAVGQLAGGVAHDFNNLLTVIQGHVGLMLADCPAPSPMRDSLCQVRGAGDRAATLTRQLLTFSRRQILQRRVVQLEEVTANVVRMLERLIGENIALILQHGPGLPPVKADPGMLEQVLINLAVNARDAMPDGGRLRIEIQSVTFAAQDLVQNAERRAGAFVCLSATDTGTGIDPAHLGRLFEPFFTTKPPGKGTGLGLATVYGVVKQHEGWIEVESRVGIGSTFRVFFPASDGASAGASPGTASAPRRGGGEGILVIEDEPALRSLMCAVLRGAGYHAWSAADGPEALALWDRHSSQVQLILSDMVMPGGITGRDLARRLRAQRPGLEVIITSGYSFELAENPQAPGAEFRFLAKPFQPADLLRVVEACLRKSRETSAAAPPAPSVSPVPSAPPAMTSAAAPAAGSGIPG